MNRINQSNELSKRPQYLYFVTINLPVFYHWTHSSFKVKTASETFKREKEKFQQLIAWDLPGSAKFSELGEYCPESSPVQREQTDGRRSTRQMKCAWAGTQDRRRACGP